MKCAWVIVLLLIAYCCDSKNLAVITKNDPYKGVNINTIYTTNTTLKYISTGESPSTNAIMNPNYNAYTYVELVQMGYQQIYQVNVTSGEFVNYANGKFPILSTLAQGYRATYLAFDSVWNEMFAIVHHGATREVIKIVKVDPTTGDCSELFTLRGVLIDAVPVDVVPDYYSAGHIWYIWSYTQNLVRIDMQAQSYVEYSYNSKQYPQLAEGVYVDQLSGTVYAQGFASESEYAFYELTFGGANSLSLNLVIQFSQAESTKLIFEGGCFDSESKLLYVVTAPPALYAVNVESATASRIGIIPRAQYHWLVLQ